MRRNFLTVFIVIGIFCSVTPAWSDSIVVYDFPGGVGRVFDVNDTAAGVSEFNFSKATPMFAWSYYSMNDRLTSTPHMLFDQLSLESLQPGTTYRIDSNSDDPDWSDFVSMLTSGPDLYLANSDILHTLNFNPGYLGVGQIGFMQLDPLPAENRGGLYGQFYGDFYLLDTAVMTGDFQGNFVSAQRGPDLLLPGSWAGAQIEAIDLLVNSYQWYPETHEYALDYTVTIHTAPEPASLFLLGIGLCGLGLFCRRNKK